ncbi:immunoglobulin-like domain-containing protein [Paucilactobacillus sp. N302-9]
MEDSNGNGTHEQFRIVNDNYGNKAKNAADYAVGTQLDNVAVYTTTLNKDVMQSITSFVTQGISRISTVLGQGGSALINGVGTIVDGLVGITGIAQIDTNGFSAVYKAELQHIIDQIDQLNNYGDTLMANGVAATSLVDVNSETQTFTDKTTGLTTQGTVFTANSEDGVATSIANMIKSYVSGWSTGIADALDAVFAGNVAYQYVPGEDSVSLQQYDGMTPVEVLKAANSSNGLYNMFGNVITGALNAASKTLTSTISGGIRTVVNQIANGVDDAIQDAIDGTIGGGSIAVAFPMTWTDPDLAQAGAVAGQFVKEAFQTNTVVFNQSTNSTTVVAYQNVDKTALKDQIAQADAGTIQNVDATALSDAKAAVADPNASQYDVDKALLALGGTVTEDVTTDVASATLKPITGTKGQTMQAALDANAATAITVTPVDGQSVNLIVTLGAGDLTPTGNEVANADGSTTQTYMLSNNGKAKLASIVTNAGYAIEDINNLSSTVTVPVASVVSGSLQPNDYVVGSSSITGTYNGDVAKAQLFINGEYTGIMGGSFAAGVFTFPVTGTNIKLTDKVELRSLTASNGVLDTVPVNVIAAPTAGTVTPAPYTVGTDNISGTFTGDVDHAQLVVNGTPVSNGGLFYTNNGSFTYWAKGSINSANDNVQIIAFDKDGKQLDSKQVTIVAAPTVGTISPAPYTVGNDNITGSFTGDVDHASLVINGAPVSNGGLFYSNGQFTYWAKDTVKTGDNVQIQAYDKDGKLLDTKNVQVSAPATQGKIMPQDYTEGADNISGSFTGDVDHASLVVNGAPVSNGGLFYDNGSFTYWAKDVVKTGDKVSIQAYDAKGKLLDTATVNVLAPATYGLIDAQEYYVGDDAI